MWLPFQRFEAASNLCAGPAVTIKRLGKKPAAFGTARHGPLAPSHQQPLAVALPRLPLFHR
ncbi:hypothetical protein A5640_06215 [Mycobacterium asiaticum]|uniref:Uncharacterized protein n=1 Tax=Mycobacterium asiaticum TaxID=1790 RepID=A0A1A3KS31_MYCAS|nr:hypothetical protein A5640_06215 [Mycobacterium asiaticum]